MVAVWICLPELPIKYYDQAILQQIRNAIGPLLKIDMHTATNTRGRFARLCVQINLSKPLVRLIRIGGTEQTVRYEGLPSLCFECGRVGHTCVTCPQKILNNSSSVNETDNGPQQPNQAQSEGSDKQQHLGPWVLVQKRKNVKSNANGGNKNKPGPSNPGNPSNQLTVSSDGIKNPTKRPYSSQRSKEDLRGKGKGGSQFASNSQLVTSLPALGMGNISFVGPIEPPEVQTASNLVPGVQEEGNFGIGNVKKSSDKDDLPGLQPHR